MKRGGGLVLSYLHRGAPAALDGDEERRHVGCWVGGTPLNPPEERHEI